MTLESDAKFEENLTCGLENDVKSNAKSEEELTCQFKVDMQNLTDFDPSTQKS